MVLIEFQSHPLLSLRPLVLGPSGSESTVKCADGDQLDLNVDLSLS